MLEIFRSIKPNYFIFTNYVLLFQLKYVNEKSYTFI